MNYHTQKEIVQRIDSHASESDWNNWKWQIKHSIRTISELERIWEFKLPEEVTSKFSAVINKFPISITPYYLSLINPENLGNDPIFMQSIPSIHELEFTKADIADSLHEDKDSPVHGITHRYPDRVLFLVSNVCAMYCRYCTRKRRVGDIDNTLARKEVEIGLDYIRKTPVIRDVLLSGGDPFLLSTNYLDWILTELRKIKHIEVIRIGTKIPVVLPQRITKEFLNMLKKHHPLWINTHFNHPQEITESSKKSLSLLADAGIPLGNQSVLLAGINDCPRIIRSLCHQLVANRVRPYYLYQCDLSDGLSHFRTAVGKGIEIIESLIGHTSGFCVPTYVIDAPGGGGKIPVMPNYLISWSTNKVVLRNYEGVITTYTEPKSYRSHSCDQDCTQCNLEFSLKNGTKYKAQGVEKLLSDYDKVITLVPEGNERVKRKNHALE